MNNLKFLFVDTSYIIGLYNADDKVHHLCVESSKYANKSEKLFTTDLVLMEIGNTFSIIKKRKQGAKIIRGILKIKHMEIIHLTPKYFDKSLELYEKRSDKEWGMVDCFSFVVMKEYNLYAALTVDHHFNQAGYKILPF
jgi:predicted nucleic acid-binding protein